MIGSVLRDTFTVLRVPSAPPVAPDAPDARNLLIDELAKPPYREAQPNWFDTLSQGVLEWFLSLFDGETTIGTGWISVVALAAAIALFIIAVVKWGVPRLNRRSRSTLSLFGEHDTRTAAQMRAAGALAAKQSNWPLAIAEQFRALATGLAERTIVSVSPGTTATDFARAAARALPFEAESLVASSAIFDEVRYLNHAGSESDYLQVLHLDDRVRASKMARLEPADSLASASRGDNGGIS